MLLLFFSCLAFRIFTVCQGQQFVHLFYEDCKVLRLYGSKQNGSAWKTYVVFDCKFTKLLVSTILVVPLAPEMNSTLTSPCGFILVPAGQVRRWLLLVTYKARSRCIQNQICLCGPSGGISHEVVLQIRRVSSFAFTVTQFER